jgi:hypothetical protein
MTYLVDVPVDGGGRLLVEASEAEVPGELELATARPGEIVARARESLEQSLDEIRPAIRSMAERIRAIGPDEFTVEFGLTLAAEYGLVVAKGAGEVHFTVTLAWHREQGGAGTDADGHG